MCGRLAANGKREFSNAVIGAADGVGTSPERKGRCRSAAQDREIRTDTRQAQPQWIPTWRRFSALATLLRPGQGEMLCWCLTQYPSTPSIGTTRIIGWIDRSGSVSVGANSGMTSDHHQL